MVSDLRYGDWKTFKIKNRALLSNFIKKHPANLFCLNQITKLKSQSEILIKNRLEIIKIERFVYQIVAAGFDCLPVI